MRSIERYLLAWILGALALGTVLVALVTYVVTLGEMNEVSDDDLRSVALALANYRQAGHSPAQASARDLPQRHGALDDSEIVTLAWTLAGQRVYASDPQVQLPFIATEGLSRPRVQGEDWIVYTRVDRDGVAQAAQRVSARQEMAGETAASVLLPMLALCGVIAGLLVFALRRGLQPLADTARDLATRSANSLEPMATADVPREIAPLVSAINDLMGRLAVAFSAQRRFLADAAHELRTPVTALRLQLQLLERAGDDASRREALKELASGIERSRHLIEQLLQVARSEPDAEALRKEPVDLGALVRAVVSSASSKAERLGIDLGASGAAGIVVPGDSHQLTVLLNNLVENALRYTPEGGVVDVEALSHEGAPALRVIDNGPGIASAERERVFDRFYRGDDARTLARDSGGSGLGLAIVQAIAERHQALVSLHTPASGRGLEVRVVFPSQPG
jgi:two-component system, OmpR family, sensor kinase